MLLAIRLVNMHYKLSNTAEREHLEHSFQMPFKHPNLYRPEIVINGLAETNLPVIISEDAKVISISIWGLLPQRYKNDWEHFQNLTNTLNIDERNIGSSLWYADAFQKRRCLILVTGFFTTILKNGVSYPYYISKNSGEPFYLGGIYNILEDGFITCALVVKTADSYLQKFHNISNTMPKIVPRKSAESWLNTDMPYSEARALISNQEENMLRANPIVKEFFNQNISYDSMLDTYEYNDLPVGE